MTSNGGTLRPERTVDQRPAAAAVLDSEAEDCLLARETAVLDRERAADRRHELADLRDEAAGGRARAEWSLREANGNLVDALALAQTDAEAAERLRVQLTWKAERDFLTGLPNRALLEDRLAQSIAIAQRRRTRVGLIYADLDHFKEINDSCGHPVGDQLLLSVAVRLQGCVRRSDTVSRQGGDEFVVLLTEIEFVEDATLVAKKLIKAMAAPHLVGDLWLSVSLSIGISLYPDDGEDADAVLRNADTARVHAKRSGENRFQRFRPDMTATRIAMRSP